MMNEYTVILADFGISLSLFEKRDYRCGTDGFIAPEINKKRVNTNDYTAAIDVFSLGIIFLEILTKNIYKNPNATIQQMISLHC